MTLVRQASGLVLEEPEIFVGKDVLGLFSSSMYVNPLSIFREYVQNATDAIDDAVELGLLTSINDGLIEITLDHIGRRIVIRDNGKGLSNNDFPIHMLSFGASEKRGTDARGFRGVGRFSGLGYVQQLLFRSRAKGDPTVMEGVWDGRVVKRMLGATDSNTDLRTIVRKSITLKRLDPEGYPDHFFEVELVRPRRIANDQLLNEMEVESFIGQVCPCPFSSRFSFGREVAELLAPHGRAGNSYRIQINGSEESVNRLYRDDILYSDTKNVRPHDFRSFQIQGIDGNISAVGWVVHHDYQGAIPVSVGVRGLRARVGNTQVGHDRLFLELFPEDRFCSWATGEVHILDARVVPNGRRDGFESNVHLDNIVAHLRPIGAEIARKCRISSQKRNRLKTFNLGADKVSTKLDVIKQGAVSESYAMSIRSEIRILLDEMRKAANFQLFEDDERAALKGRLALIEVAFDAYDIKVDGDLFENLPTGRLATYNEVFDLIYECSLNQVAAKGLVDRMLDRLSRC